LKAWTFCRRRKKEPKRQKRSFRFISVENLQKRKRNRYDYHCRMIFEEKKRLLNPKTQMKIGYALVKK
jgi:hypothetical protein